MKKQNWLKLVNISLLAGAGLLGFIACSSNAPKAEAAPAAATTEAAPAAPSPEATPEAAPAAP